MDLNDACLALNLGGQIAEPEHDAAVAIDNVFGSRFEDVRQKSDGRVTKNTWLRCGAGPIFRRSPGWRAPLQYSCGANRRGLAARSTVFRDCW